MFYRLIRLRIVIFEWKLIFRTTKIHELINYIDKDMADANVTYFIFVLDLDLVDLFYGSSTLQSLFTFQNTITGFSHLYHESYLELFASIVVSLLYP